MIHVLVLITAAGSTKVVAGAPHLGRSFVGGERYNLPEDLAAALVADGKAEALEVLEGQPFGETTEEERAACLERVRAKAPPPATRGEG